jgi:uncharacterized protein YdaU (DUF1376 family)
MKKQKDPAFLFYSGDFLAGTYTMSFEERGKYITLLCIQHQKGYLTDGDMKSVLTEEDIVIAEKFIKKSDGYWYNEKLTNEIIRRKEYTANRLKNFQKKKDMNTHMNSHMGNDMELHTGTETGTDKLETKTENINETSIEYTNAINDKDTKELLNTFDTIFSGV